MGYDCTDNSLYEPKDNVCGIDIRNSPTLTLGNFLTVGCYLWFSHVIYKRAFIGPALLGVNNARYLKVTKASLRGTIARLGSKS